MPYEETATFPSPVLGGEVALDDIYDLCGL